MKTFQLMKTSKFKSHLKSILRVLQLISLPFRAHSKNIPNLMEGHSSGTSLLSLLFSLTLFSLSVNTVAEVDIIRANQIIKDGTSIISAGGHFELGFISPGRSTNRYVGIWYKNIPTRTIVWIANRETPLNTTTGVLKLNSNGSLVILNGSNKIVWSSNSSASVNNPVAQLLDSGNFVIRDETDSSPENFLWQSFDITGNTFLAGNKLGWNLETGLERYLSSWKSEDDPSPGEYTYHIDRNGFPQLILRKGSSIDFRPGPWNGVRFSGMPYLIPNPIFTFDFVSNDKELYYQYSFVNSSVVTRVILHPLGYIQRWVWIEKYQIWQLYTSQIDDCDRYALCGAYGSCHINKSPPCECLDGFQQKSQKEWDVSDWSSGCVRKVPLTCGDGEGFVKHSGFKLPDTQKSWFNNILSLDECRSVCLKNCSCTAYANTDIRGSGSGCLLWFNELIDIREYKENGQDIYIRMAASELAASKLGSKGRPELRLMIIPIVLTVPMMLGIYLCIIRKKRIKHMEAITRQYYQNDWCNGNGDDDVELPLFDFTALANATNGFSTDSKLGEGGFGPVYKGMLDETKEIAVKRLSKNSTQGLQEFKNEVSCIARLQHRNLVKLLGCSVQEGERMLVYEYMPNKSLDSFIFDKEQSKALDWPMRYNIINGIARGLLYLHQDSRLRIIHRDLKASNILLDLEMNPKISDFGTARICGETETGANTTRVVGTYGYMSPEYAIDGEFSVKSDVYSFGVLLLEVVSGKRNKNFTHPDHNLNLLGHAWRMYTNGEVLDIVDEVIAKSSHEHQFEVFRGIQIGLLCVQQYPADRPTVVLMLTSEIPLPRPKDIIRANETVRDGSVIVSSGGHFELGFTSIGNSTNRYVGIWYKKIPKKTIVWIANRETPLNTKSALLILNSNGNLVILNSSNYVVWSSNSSTSENNPVVQLLDTGNLVIRDENDKDTENYLWQSFDKPGNTFLPGCKLGWNLETGLERYISSWKSEDDPSLGEYTIRIDRNGYPQLLMRKGFALHSRAGPWNGVRFSGTPNFKANPIYRFYFVLNNKELNYYYQLLDDSVSTRIVLSPLGCVQRWVWIEKSQSWKLYLTGPTDDCGRYARCGAYGSCNINRSPACECLNGFEPKTPKDWNAADWSSGCARKVDLSCADGEGFVKHSGLILPDTQSSWFDRNMSLDECKRLCFKNCSCTAYANTDIRGSGSGSGCLLWFDELIDIREQEENGQDVYIRMAASELAKKGRSKVRIIIIPILLTVIAMLGACLWVIRKKRKCREGIRRHYFDENWGIGNGDEDVELPFFDFSTLANATNGFSTNSKLGEGGFGPVYKGMLDEGKEVAVKRLSKNSRQGLEEFKNEVSCIAQLQHRNLVKLLGCSVQEGERMLVYEYMPNKSLDLFIFDKNQRNKLDWPMRSYIINGIARGLLYLHQDSRLRIIHRDLKTSNVLLDHDMNPKISDFGMARICRETETGAETTRVVGTYGYMSPEYAIDGVFSVKSDVYSFGVMLLEIVSGKRNKTFSHPDHSLNLLGHAWRSYTDGNVFELIDEAIAQSSQEYEFEVFRAIQIGLLCVQQYPADRPTMATVVLTLTSKIPLAQPKQPGFFIERKLREGESSSPSSNYLSVTTMVPR